MFNTNPNAAAILALPEAQHPRLTELARRLAAKPDLTTNEAAEVLQAAATGAGITSMDIDMIQPGANVAVPFVPATSTDPGAAYSEGVAALVHAKLGPRR